MSYDHKIVDLKYHLNGLVPKEVCHKIIEIFEKYTDLSSTEGRVKRV